MALLEYCWQLSDRPVLPLGYTPPFSSTSTFLCFAGFIYYHTRYHDFKKNLFIAFLQLLEYSAYSGRFAAILFIAVSLALRTMLIHSRTVSRCWILVIITTLQPTTWCYDIRSYMYNHKCKHTGIWVSIFTLCYMQSPHSDPGLGSVQGTRLPLRNLNFRAPKATRGDSYRDQVLLELQEWSAKEQ